MRGQAGFTLLEMLVAMTVMALVLTLATASLRMTGLASEKGAAVAERTAALGTVGDLLRREAHAALRMVGAGAPIRFQGEPGRATWLVAEPGYIGSPGLAQVSFRVDGLASGRQQLRFARAPLTGPASGGPAPEELLLLESDDRFVFDYYGQPTAESGPGWVAAWRDRAAPPLLLRLRKLDRDGAQTWPALIVALPVDAEAGCLPRQSPAGAAGTEAASGQGSDAASPDAPAAVPSSPFSAMGSAGGSAGGSASGPAVGSGSGGSGAGSGDATADGPDAISAETPAPPSNPGAGSAACTLARARS